MDDEMAKYKEDPRIPCTYGRKCYQKNPVHHNKYKHPPDPKRKRTFNRTKEVDNKKIKTSDDSHMSASNENRDDSHSELVNKEEIKTFDDNHMSASHENKDDSHSELVNREAKISNDVSDSDQDEANESCHETSDACNLHVCDEKVEHIDQKILPKECNHADGHNNEASKNFIVEKFLLEMPDDFFQFHKLCESLNPKEPSEAFSTAGLKLVGPFDVLSGRFCGISDDLKDEDYLIHWRYFHDPPQMQTVLKGDDKTGYHIGYFWDSPTEKPVFLVENYALKNGVLTAIGENIFAAVYLYLQSQLKTAVPFVKIQFNKLINAVKNEAVKLGFSLDQNGKNITKRNNKILTRSFNKIGLVVPYERKTQLGYRKLAITDKALHNLLTKIQNAENSEEKQKLLGELQAEVLTWTDIALDECDFGTGIELGWDIISHDVEYLNHTASRFLVSSYRQLKWEPFARIAEAHMAKRKKGCELSIL